MTRSRLFLLALFAVFFFARPGLAARDASFLAPSATMGAGAARNENAVGIEPKAEIDLGETGMNVAKRTTLFFVNQSNLPVGVLDVKANGDSNVVAEIVSDDCSRGKKIETASKCAVSVEVTPKGTGSWTAEVLMTHEGAGRLTRAKLTGKTSSAAVKKESAGLALSTKDIKPVDFGKIDADADKAVRSALMVNDSDEPITILSIEVIAAENGLEKLDQGCAEDMDLAPGESCPVTLVWNPKRPGNLSTDLIIRHTGRLGFAVIPIRGVAEESKAARDLKTGADSKAGVAGGKSVPLSPTAEDVEKAMQGRVQALPSSTLPVPYTEEAADMDGFHLIGTVGTRALLYMPDGSTKVVGVGEEIALGGEGKLKLLNVTAKQAEILLNGEKKTLSLEAVSALTSKAALRAKEKAAAARPPAKTTSKASSKNKSSGSE